MRAPPSPPWVCPGCGFMQNGGAPEPGAHECDTRSIARLQAQRLVTPDETLDLEGWLDL